MEFKGLLTALLLFIGYWSAPLAHDYSVGVEVGSFQSSISDAAPGYSVQGNLDMGSHGFLLRYQEYDKVRYEVGQADIIHDLETYSLAYSHRFHLSPHWFLRSGLGLEYSLTKVANIRSEADSTGYLAELGVGYQWNDLTSLVLSASAHSAPDFIRQNWQIGLSLKVDLLNVFTSSKPTYPSVSHSQPTHSVRSYPRMSRSFSSAAEVPVRPQSEPGRIQFRGPAIDEQAFFIQVGAYRDSQYANQFMNEAGSLGKQVLHLSPRVKGDYHRVLIGPFDNHAQAAKALLTVREWSDAAFIKKVNRHTLGTFQ